MDNFFFQFNKSLVHSISDETANYDGSIHLWNLTSYMGIVDEMAQSLVCPNKYLQNDDDDGCQGGCQVPDEKQRYRSDEGLSSRDEITPLLVGCICLL